MGLQPLLPRKIVGMGPIGDAPPPPDLSGMSGPVPVVPLPTPPLVSMNPRLSSVSSDPLIQRRSELDADLYNRSNPIKPTTTLGKIGHVAAGVGNVLGDIFAPDVMANIPHTQLYNERIMQRDKADLDQVSQLQTAEEGRKNTAANTEYTQARPEIEQAKINQKRDLANNKNAATLAQHGFTYAVGPDGTPQIDEDTTSQAYKDRQALTDYRVSLKDYKDVQAENAGNKYKPGTPQYAEWETKLQQAQQRIGQNGQKLGLEAGNLALHQSEFGFNQDKFYNPQPTGQERTKGDLATSAAHYVDVMHEVRKAHPEIFGPAAGRTTDFESWIGSQSPDAQRYLAASHIAKDHLTAVFGARSKYALEGTGTLFDPKMNNDAFEGQYGDLKTSIGTFQRAGSTHGRGETGYAASHSTVSSGNDKIKKFNAATGRLE